MHLCPLLPKGVSCTNEFSRTSRKNTTLIGGKPFASAECAYICASVCVCVCSEMAIVYEFMTGAHLSGIKSQSFSLKVGACFLIEVQETSEILVKVAV